MLYGVTSYGVGDMSGVVGSVRLPAVGALVAGRGGCPGVVPSPTLVWPRPGLPVAAIHTLLLAFFSIAT